MYAQSSSCEDLILMSYFSASSFSPAKGNDKGSSATVEQSSNKSCKRACPDEWSISPKRKGKMKAREDDLQGVLLTYEDELTCPMYVCLTPSGVQPRLTGL